MIFSKLTDFSCSTSRSSTRAGINDTLISVTAATCIAVGKLYSVRKDKRVTQYNIRVVATLTHVHMVIGVNRFLGAKFSSQNLNGSIWDDLTAPSQYILVHVLRWLKIYLVHIHVALRTTSCLKDNQRKMIDKTSWYYLRGMRTHINHWRRDLSHHLLPVGLLGRFLDLNRIQHSLSRRPSLAHQKLWWGGEVISPLVHRCQSSAMSFLAFKFILVTNQESTYRWVWAPQ